MQHFIPLSVYIFESKDFCLRPLYFFDYYEALKDFRDFHINPNTLKNADLIIKAFQNFSYKSTKSNYEKITF